VDVDVVVVVHVDADVVAVMFLYDPKFASTVATATWRAA